MYSRLSQNDKKVFFLLFVFFNIFICFYSGENMRPKLIAKKSLIILIFHFLTLRCKDSTNLGIEY